MRPQAYPPTSRPCRRDASRRPTRLPGWIYLGQLPDARVQEVEMVDESDGGAGFMCVRRLDVGQPLHLKIGIGPGRRPRPAVVRYVHPRAGGVYRVGVAFVGVGAVTSAA